MVRATGRVVFDVPGDIAAVVVRAT